MGGAWDGLRRGSGLYMHAVRAVRAARSYGSACEQGLAWGPGGPKELQKKRFGEATQARG